MNSAYDWQGAMKASTSRERSVRISRARNLWGSGSSSRKSFFALDRAQHGHPKLILEKARSAGKHAVRQLDEIRLVMAGNPVRHLGELLALMALFAAQYGHGQCAEVSGVRRGAESVRNPAQQPGRSKSQSTNLGVCRKKPSFSCRKTLMPP